jgi:hypothetical protein
VDFASLKMEIHEFATAAWDGAKDLKAIAFPYEVCDDSDPWEVDFTSRLEIHDFAMVDRGGANPWPKHEPAVWCEDDWREYMAIDSGEVKSELCISLVLCARRRRLRLSTMTNKARQIRMNPTATSTPARMPTSSFDLSLCWWSCPRCVPDGADGDGTFVDVEPVFAFTMKYSNANGVAEDTFKTLMARLCLPFTSPDAKKSGWSITRWAASGSVVTTGAAASMEYAAVGGWNVALLAGTDPYTVIPVPSKLKDREDPTTPV